MNRDKSRRTLSALAISMLAACLVYADDNAVTYDVRVFKVTKPVTKFPFAPTGAKKTLLGLIDLQKGGWTPESGLPLNETGDVLFWDGEKSVSSPGIERLASEDGVGDCKTLSVVSGKPLQYLEPRPGGRYELKISDYELGFSLTLASAGNGQTRAFLKNELSATREHLPDVSLDVGKPGGSILHCVVVRTPSEQWGDCIVLDTGAKETGCLFVFVRMHGHPAPVDKTTTEQFSVEFKFLSISPEADAKLNGAFKLDPPGSTCVKEIFAPGEARPFAKLNEITDWLGGVEGVELLSAPRVRTTSLRAKRANASDETFSKIVKQTIGEEPTRKNSMFDTIQTSPTMKSVYGRLAQPGFAIIADFATFQTETAGAATTDWNGAAAMLTVDGCETPGTAIVDFAAVHRYRAPDTSTPRDRVEPLKRTGPVFERIAKDVPQPPILESGIVSKATLNAGEWRAFTTIEPGTGNRLLLFVTAEPAGTTRAKSTGPGAK